MPAGAIPWRQAERRVRYPVEGSAGRMAASVPKHNRSAVPGLQAQQTLKSGRLQNRQRIGSYGLLLVCQSVRFYSHVICPL